MDPLAWLPRFDLARVSFVQDFGRHDVLLYRADSAPHNTRNYRYRQMRGPSAKREIHRAQGLCSIHNGFNLISFD